jgi:putative transposase
LNQRHQRAVDLFIDALEAILYPPDIRKVIYTTNAIESANMSLRKITKTRGSFPTDDAVFKLFYLALNNISQKWTMPIRDWKAALNRFTIQFDERMPRV